MASGREIARITATRLDLQLLEPFGISTGTQEVAANVLVTVELTDGTIGLGEAAPFPAVSGETQDSALEAIHRVKGDLIGVDVARTRLVAALGEQGAPDDPSARCAIEQAVFDAFARHAGLPLWALFGGAGGELETDMTIPTGSIDHARTSARAITERAISTLKIKVGAVEIPEDVERVRAAAREAEGARIVIDANGAYTPGEAIEIVEALREHGIHIALFEQPVSAEDLDGLARVTRDANVSVCADESARTVADVLAIVDKRAATAINVKLMKSGVAHAMEMVAIAKAAGLDLMIGGMVESILSMTFSAHFASGLGGFAYADLDTPLFVRSSPFTGGFRLDRGRIVLDGIDRGVGVSLT